MRSRRESAGVIENLQHRRDSAMSTEDSKSHPDDDDDDDAAEEDMGGTKDQAVNGIGSGTMRYQFMTDHEVPVHDSALGP